MAKLLLLDCEKNNVVPVECNDLDDYYKYLKCGCFDIARRYINGRMFDIFCDDCGLFVENPIVSAFSSADDDGGFFPQLVGNLIFANHDEMGETTSLSDDDMKHIMKNVIKYRADDKIYTAVVNCE